MKQILGILSMICLSLSAAAALAATAPANPFPKNPTSREVCDRVHKQYYDDLSSGKIAPSDYTAARWHVGSDLARDYSTCIDNAPDTTEALLAIFPAQPTSQKQCFDAGQQWLKNTILPTQRAADKAADRGNEPYHFNMALTHCLGKTPESKRFVLPKSADWLITQQRKAAGYAKIPHPRGGWVLVDLNFNSQGSVYRITGSENPIVIQQGNSGGGYFYGLDFKRYPLTDKGDSVSILFASHGDHYGYITRNIYHQIPATALRYPDGNIPDYRNIHQGDVERTSYDPKTHQWKSEKTILMVEPDKENSLPKLVEKRVIRQAENSEGLNTAQSSTTLTTYRWNGSSFSADDPVEWLAYLHRPAPVYAKITTTKNESAPITLGKLTYKTYSIEKRPVNKTGGNKAEWFEITQGMNTATMKKINAAVKAQTLDATKDPEAIEREQDGNVEYVESTILVRPKYQVTDTLTVFQQYQTMPPFTRSYDDGQTYSYDLNTGEVIHWRDSFQSPEAYESFCNTLDARPRETLIQMQSDYVNISPEEGANCVIYPKEDGLGVNWESSDGGHYFENKTITIAYNKVPRTGILADSRLMKLILEMVPRTGLEPARP